MGNINFASIKDVLKEAGFYHIKQGDRLKGAVDGTNKAFLTSYKPIYDTDKVVVLVDDVAITISDIDAEKGLIELDDAPAANATVVADYYYSVVPEPDVQQRIDEAQAYVNSFMAGFDDCYPYINAEKIPSVIRQFTRLYAAGLLLIKDYGYNVDTELTSKDGYKKIAFAKEILTDYRDSGGCNGGGAGDALAGSENVNAGSCGDLFDRPRGGDRHCGDRCEDGGFSCG